MTDPSAPMSQTLRDHVERPRNLGTLEAEAPNVGSGLASARDCGDFMRLQIAFDEATGRIAEARFQSNFGCSTAIGTSSLATEWLKGKTVDEALAITDADLRRELALPPVKLQCSLLAEDAIRMAIQDLQRKRAQAKEKGSHPSE